MKSFSIALAFLALGGAVAQTPAPATPPPAATPAPVTIAVSPVRADPAKEVLSWNGQNWNVNDQRIFQSRFEKYLNAPEATSAEDSQYQAIITEILNRLAQGTASTANLDYAYRLLPRAAAYDMDARLCDSLADAVYTVWSSQRQQQRLAVANSAMDYEIQLAELRGAGRTAATQAAAEGKKEKAPRPAAPGGIAIPALPAIPDPTAIQSEQANESKKAMQDTMDWKSRRLAEMIARQKGNSLKRELSEIQAKMEYQALIVQFFIQRRFQHVLMATRFYRAIFADGDAKLNVGDETRELFSRGSGMAPTVSTLDALANEAVRDVRESVKAFDFLLTNNELESATKRLAEAFTVGEHMPEIRTVAREKKRRALAFSQKSFQLLSALEVKDYGLAEKLVKELGPIAQDFDASKPTAAIETARTVATMRLAKARNAALSGDSATLEKELTAATELWPRNPALADISRNIFDQGDVQQRALSDFDQLLGQKNFRQILENSGRFIAATAQFPEKQELLKKVLADMQGIEGAILRAEEMGRQQNFAGAWESVEKASALFPSDPKLSQKRADLTTQSADFVRALRGAQDLEKRNQVGSSLAWYLKAQRLYPASDYAQEGVVRLSKRILP